MMVKRFFSAVCGLMSVLAGAGDGVWINPTQGEWMDAANWQDGQIASGAGALATIMYGHAAPRTIHVPEAGVTVGDVRVGGDRNGWPVIWGGPLTLAGGRNELIGSDYDPRLAFANTVKYTGDLTMSRIQVFNSMNATGNAIVPANCDLIVRFLFGANAAETMPYDFLPTGKITFQGSSSVTITPRAPSAARTAQFVLTEGSTLAVRASADLLDELATGCLLTGDGVAEGTFVKTALGDGHLALSQPATASGTFTLGLSAMVGGGHQQFAELRAENGTVSMKFENRNSGGIGTSNPSMSIGKYTSAMYGKLYVTGWGGLFSLGVGKDDCAGGLWVDNTVPVEVRPLETGAFLGSLRASGTGPNVTIPSGTLAVGTFTGESVLTKKGAGTLALKGLPYGGGAAGVTASEGGLSVSSGDWTAPVTLPEGVRFHVDATKLASFSLIEENGTNFVDRWHDASGGAMWAGYVDRGTFSGHQINRRPYLRTNVLSGLPVVDFGTAQSTISWQWINGWGGSLHWSSAIPNVREVFMVVADSRGDYMSYMPYLTNKIDGNNNYPFLRAPEGVLCNQEQNADACLRVRNGLVQLDGETVASDTVVPDGFHLVRFRTTDNVRADSFCSDRTYGEGGLLIGESIVYDRVLTDEEADFIENYLMAKWFRTGTVPARTMAAVTTSSSGAELTVEEGQTLVISSLTMNGPVTKKGLGTLRIEAIDNPNDFPVTIEAGAVDVPEGETLHVRRLDVVEDGSLTKTGSGTLETATLGGHLAALAVKGGTLRLANGAKPAGAFFHVDASAAGTYDTFEQNGRTYVSSVRDASGGPVTAAPKQSKWGTIANPSPYIDRSYLGGKPVFNFGTMYTQEQPSGEGGNLCWSAKANDFRECFLVYADHPSCVEAGVGQFILGGHMVGDDNIHPFWRAGLQLFHYNNVYTAMGCSTILGLKEVDGIAREWNYPLPGGFHILHFRTARDPAVSPEKGLADVMVNAFASEREYSMGGQLIAEAVIFDGASLSEDAAKSVYDYLYAKWFKTGGSVAYAMDSLSVAKGAVCDFGALEAKTGALSGEGTLVAPRVTLAEGAVWDVPFAGSPLTVPALTVNGVLAFSSSGTVRVSLPAEVSLLPSGDYLLATATGYEGEASLANWEIHAPAGSLRNKRAALMVKNGRVVLSVWDGGLSLIVR